MDAQSAFEERFRQGARHIAIHLLKYLFAALEDRHLCAKRGIIMGELHGDGSASQNDHGFRHAGLGEHGVAVQVSDFFESRQRHFFDARSRG